MNKGILYCLIIGGGMLVIGISLGLVGIILGIIRALGLSPPEIWPRGSGALLWILLGLVASGIGSMLLIGSLLAHLIGPEKVSLGITIIGLAILGGLAVSGLIGLVPPIIETIKEYQNLYPIKTFVLVGHFKYQVLMKEWQERIGGEDSVIIALYTENIDNQPCVIPEPNLIDWDGRPAERQTNDLRAEAFSSQIAAFYTEAIDKPGPPQIVYSAGEILYPGEGYVLLLKFRCPRGQAKLRVYGDIEKTTYKFISIPLERDFK